MGKYRVDGSGREERKRNQYHDCLRELTTLRTRITELEGERDSYRAIVKEAHEEGYHDGYERLGSKENCWEISDTCRELDTIARKALKEGQHD